jgi:hypothetical protein
VGLKERLRRLELETEGEIMTVVCLECTEEFTAHGDVPVEYIVHEWGRETGERGHKTPKDILRIFDHEHDPSAFVEKHSGLPFLSKAVSGMDLCGVVHVA